MLYILWCIFIFDKGDLRSRGFKLFYKRLSWSTKLYKEPWKANDKLSTKQLINTLTII